uniref:Uncharacterized protein n=1 Tax=Rhipicephalus zambeziensis TaxID=60191 RepID=A0A224YCS1_9ACAR
MVRSVVTGAAAVGHDLSTRARAITLKSRVFEEKKREKLLKVTKRVRSIFFPRAISPCLASSAFDGTREERMQLQRATNLCNSAAVVNS